MPGPEERPPFEILEHTADIGLRVWGETIERLFENAVQGLVEVAGATGIEDQAEEAITFMLKEPDLGAALVALLNSVIYVIDREEARVSRVEVVHKGPLFRCWVWWQVGSPPPDGTELKAATYHQLKVEETEAGCEATVYFDV